MAAHKRDAADDNRSIPDLPTFSPPTFNFSTPDISIRTQTSVLEFELSTFDWSSQGTKSKASLVDSAKSFFPGRKLREATSAGSGLSRHDESTAQQEDVIQPPPTSQPNNEITGWKLGVLVASLCSSVFCVALDNTILATAIPRITDEFGTIDDIGWYGASYFLTVCSKSLAICSLGQCR